MTNTDGSTLRSRLIGIVGTLVFHALVLLVLLLMVMAFNKARKVLMEELAAMTELEEQEDDETLLLAGEYVTVGDDFFAQATTPQETAPASQASNAVAGGDAMLTTTAPAPIKAAPARYDEAAEEARRRALQVQKDAKQKQTQAAEISERVKFGTSGEENASTKRPGSADGNVQNGAPVAGKPGANLKGRTLSSWDSPRATTSGTIVIAVRVDRQGRVTDASYASGTGSVASDAAARRACIAAARRSAFSVSTDAPAEQTGTITYRFVPPSK